MRDEKDIRLPWSDWKIVRYIGGGAYGKVYEIQRNISGIQEKAALKIISKPKDEKEIETLADNGYDKASIVATYEKEIKGYVQEYKILRELQGQTNIVSCDDFTVIPHENGIGGDIFIRMELLTSLQQVLRERLLSEEEILKLGKDIAKALILCETKHIIHRDIKPMNVMISQFGDYKLGDFGVSKMMDHTTFGSAAGTPEYQAPEVVHMEKYGHTADIYSLGIMLYWLLNNRKMPFIGADTKITPDIREEAMQRRYRGEKLPAPKNGSARFKEIVLKACEYRPEDRYASAKELYDALDAVQNGRTRAEDVQKTPVTTPKTPVKPVHDDTWGSTGGTIGKPGAGVKAAKGPDQQKTGGAIGKGAAGKAAGGAPAQKYVPENDEAKKRENQIKAEIASALEKIPVERETEKNRRTDAILALLFVVGGATACMFGIIWLGVILVFLGMMSLANEIGSTDFNVWMKANKEKISNIDDLIKNHPEFAKRLYYEKCPNKHMLYYMEKKNPTVAKEIKAAQQKK